MTNEPPPIIFLLSLFILGTRSNLLQPEYSITIVNTENIILSLGDLDEQNDLELIKASPDPALEKKLIQFHKYVSLLEAEKKAKAKSWKVMHHKPMSQVSEFELSNEEVPFTGGLERKHWRLWERKPERKRERKTKFKKRLSKNFKLKKSIKHKADIVKRQMPTSLRGVKPNEEYDYLEKEYWDFVNKSLANKTAFKYSEEGKPEESVKDIIRTITDVKTPKNCSEVVSLGVQAVECAVKNFKDKEINKKEMFKRISVIVLAWIGLYMVFAVPLWCTKGWCCCCFRCEFCLPVRTVRKIQKYLAQNPPGVYINENGEEERYNPTTKETDLYERLTRSIAEF